MNKIINEHKYLFIIILVIMFDSLLDFFDYPEDFFLILNKIKFKYTYFKFYFFVRLTSPFNKV